MNKVSLLFCTALLFIGSQCLIAATSRTTEFHELKTSLTADKTQNITLPTGFLATGFVKDQAGHPIKGAFVSAELLGAQVAAVGGITDATGKFTIPVQAGTYTFFVSPPRSASVAPGAFSRLVRNKLENIAISSDATVGTITLSNGFIVSGTVTGPTGPISLFSGVFWTFPVPGGTIGFQAAQFGSTQATTSQYAIALPAGAYKTEMIPILAYSSTFQPVPAAYTTSSFTLSADKVLNVKLRKGALLSGAVLDATKKPLTGFVWIYPKGTFEPGVYVALGSVVSGKYQTYLPPGNYTATFVPFEDATYTGHAASVTQNLVMTAATKTLNFSAPNGVALSGKVTDAHGKPLKSSGVMLRGSTNNPWGPNQITYAAFALSTPSGQYRVVVPKGTYDVVAYPAATPAH